MLRASRRQAAGRHVPRFQRTKNHMQWYYVEAGRQEGPVEEAVLEELVRSGRVQPEPLVGREGMANWQPYRVARPAPAGAAPPELTSGRPAEPAPAATGAAPGPDQV